MNGNKILECKIGKILNDGRFQSFYLNGNLIHLINVTFLKFDNWIKIVSSDEQTDISVISDEFDSIKRYGDSEFNYPLTSIAKSFPEFNKYIGQRLIGFKELIFNHKSYSSFGLNMYFDNGLNFIIHNQNCSIEKIEYIFENKIPNDLTEK